MNILSQDKQNIITLESCNISISNTDTSKYQIVCLKDFNKLCIGEYNTADDAITVMVNISTSIANGENVYEMPSKDNVSSVKHIRDKVIKG